MRHVWHAMMNSLVIIWSLVLYCCFRDFRFPAALFVAVIGIALIVQLLKRVGRALTRIVMTLALIVMALALIADPPFQSRLVAFLNEIFIFDCPHAVVWATVYTMCYALLHVSRPAVQRPA